MHLKLSWKFLEASLEAICAFVLSWKAKHGELCLESLLFQN